MDIDGKNLKYLRRYYSSFMDEKSVDGLFAYYEVAENELEQQALYLATDKIKWLETPCVLKKKFCAQFCLDFKDKWGVEFFKPVELQALDRMVHVVSYYYKGKKRGYDKELLLQEMLDKAMHDFVWADELKTYIQSMEKILLVPDDGELFRTCSLGGVSSKDCSSLNEVRLVGNAYCVPRVFTAFRHEIRHVVTDDAIANLPACVGNFVSEADAGSVSNMGEINPILYEIFMGRYRGLKKQKPSAPDFEILVQASRLLKGDIVNLYLRDRKERFDYYQKLQMAGVVNFPKSFFLLAGRLNGFDRALRLVEKSSSKTRKRLADLFASADLLEAKILDFKSTYRQYYNIDPKRIRVNEHHMVLVENYLTRFVGEHVSMGENFLNSLVADNRSFELSSGLFSFVSKRVQRVGFYQQNGSSLAQKVFQSLKRSARLRGD